ncbi:MAG: ketopantoate reductase family protein [Mogibacterium sp.]|nr:ketopantoate reductase family protein [Mogibacterium sp.]
MKISIIGMGAMGLLFGSIITKNCGPESVEFLMDDARYEKNCGKKFTCNGEQMDFRMTKFSDATPADLVIVAVKATGLEDAIKGMKNAIGENTAIISVLNGISSEQMIGDVHGYRNVVYCVAQGMDAMKFDNELTYSKIGEVRVGLTEKVDPQIYKNAVSILEKTGINFIEEEDIHRRMWGKFVQNVGFNQTCMVYGITCGESMIEGSVAFRTLIAAMREVVAIAHAEGIPLSEADINQYIELASTFNKDGVPSMAQDRINGRYSEVESFAGTVIKYAKKHNIYVPENEYLYKRVKEIEAEY